MSRSDEPPPVADEAAACQYRPVTRDEITQRLELVRIEHRDLDHAIAALAEAGVPDQLQVARFKKRKLKLRDEIAWLEDKLIPDIIA